MSKTPTDREKIRRQVAEDPETFTNDELIAAVCKYFCRGMPVAEIRKNINGEAGHLAQPRAAPPAPFFGRPEESAQL